MNKNYLYKSSKSFVRKTDENCLVLTLNKEKTGLELCGDNVWVAALRDKPELLQCLDEALTDATNKRNEEEPLEPVVYPEKFPRLFALPGSNKWRSAGIRNQFSTYLGFYG